MRCMYSGLLTNHFISRSTCGLSSGFMVKPLRSLAQMSDESPLPASGFVSAGLSLSNRAVAEGDVTFRSPAADAAWAGVGSGAFLAVSGELVAHPARVRRTTTGRTCFLILCQCM